VENRESALLLLKKEKMSMVLKEKLPQDTENTIYIEVSGIDTIKDLISNAQDKWGEEIELDKLKIEHEHIQVKCFGYDQYDSSDYRNYFVITKI
jgi:hypothetical protein